VFLSHVVCSLEKYGWVRVLVEGNPGYRQKLLQNSPLAYSANAVLCEKHAMMHYANIGTKHASQLFYSN